MSSVPPTNPVTTPSGLYPVQKVKKMPWKKDAPYKDFNDCVAHMKGKKGVDDPKKYCGALEQKFKAQEDPEDKQDALKDLEEQERREHPDWSDEQVRQAVQKHVQQLKGNRIQFGVDSDYQFYNRFQAGEPTTAGDIPLTGMFLDFEATTNGWYIDPAEESNLVSDQGRVTFRVAHSKEPERVIGEYKRFWAAEDDGCTDAYGKPLSRHIDFEAVTNPADPQLRTNIVKGWVNDISPGLDAEVFCSECNEPWGLDENNKLVKSCEHQDALGVLRHILKKEGSMVTEPAFEGRTQFRMPTFAMTMNSFFSPDDNESEPVATRVSPRAGQQASDDGRQSKQGGNIMSQNSSEKKEKETDGEYKFSKLELKALKAMRVKADAEGEGEGEGDGQDDDARIRAALPLIKKKLADAGRYTKMLKDIVPQDNPPDDQAEANAEGEGEGEGKMETEAKADSDKPGVPPHGPTMMSAEDQKIVADAQAYKAKLEAQKIVTESKSILAQKEEDDKLANLTSARNILEKTGDKEGAARLDATITTLAKTRLEGQKKESSTKGAETPSAEINFSASQEIATGSMPRFNAAAKARFEQSFQSDFWGKFKERSYQR